MMDEILFYIREEPYGWLSNFERTPLIVDGKIYPTNEHYFQSQKGKTSEIQEYIRMAPNATIAMGLGRMLEQQPYDKYLADDWNETYRKYRCPDCGFKFEETPPEENIPHTTHKIQIICPNCYGIAKEACEIDYPKKLNVMLKGLRCKFRNPRLCQLLLETGDAIIHENSALDFFWGIGDGTGESWLGKLLMQVREDKSKCVDILGQE